MTSPPGATAPPAPYCSNCGAAAAGNFCSSCGSAIGVATPPPQQSVQTPQPAWGANASVSFSPGMRGTNGMAIAALVAAFFVAPAGFVLALVAKSQIRRTGEDGDGLATAALVVSLFSMIIWIVIVASFVHTQNEIVGNVNQRGPTFP